jgi:uncharacterized protein (TIGR02996 family)
VIERPDDDAVRLVYADWLEEHGGEADRARAEFIRVQIEKEGLEAGDPRAAALTGRARELEKRFRKEWLAGLESDQSYMAIFRRGFVDSWQCPSAQAFLCAEGSLFDREPVTSVFLPCGPGNVAALSASSRLSRLEALVLVPGEDASDAQVAELFRSEFLTGLRLLEISHMGRVAGPATAYEIATRPQYARLERLGLSGQPLGDEGAIHLARSSTLRCLEMLLLGSCEMGGIGVEALAQSGVLESVVDLDLSGNLARPQVVQGLSPLAGRRLGKLARLTLWGTIFEDAVLARVAWADWPALESFDLSAGYGAESALSPVGLAALAVSPLAGRLADLQLNDHSFGDAGVAALVEGRFPRLVSLGLGATRTGVDGLRALVRAPFAPQLVELLLGGCRFGDAGAAVLAGAHLPALRSLWLASCEIGEEGALALAGSAHLPAELTLDLQGNRPVSAGTLARLRERFSDVYHNSWATGGQP